MRINKLVRQRTDVHVINFIKLVDFIILYMIYPGRYVLYWQIIRKNLYDKYYGPSWIIVVFFLDVEIGVCYKPNKNSNYIIHRK